jgi:hypothetical protein
MITRLQTVGWLLAGSLSLVPATAAQVQATTWTGGTGDWGTGANWSSGEPSGSDDALFQALGEATVSQAGESCRNLLLGTSGSVTVNVVAGGSLAVTNRIQIPVAAQGKIYQDGGSVTADSLVLGAAGSYGEYEMKGGTLTVGHAIVGMAPGANLSTGGVANPVMTVTHSLRLGAFADIVAGAGSISVGTSAADSLVVAGTFQITGVPTMTTTNYVMRNGSVLSAFVFSGGIAPIVSSGVAILEGTLKVQDFGATNGTYELVRGNPLSGTFDEVQLPAAGDWSWHIAGNSLFISRGPVATETTTWSRIKLGTAGNR